MSKEDSARLVIKGVDISKFPSERIFPPQVSCEFVVGEKTEATDMATVNDGSHSFGDLKKAILLPPMYQLMCLDVRLVHRFTAGRRVTLASYSIPLDSLPHNRKIRVSISAWTDIELNFQVGICTNKSLYEAPTAAALPAIILSFRTKADEDEEQGKEAKIVAMRRRVENMLKDVPATMLQNFQSPEKLMHAVEHYLHRDGMDTYCAPMENPSKEIRQQEARTVLAIIKSDVTGYRPQELTDKNPYFEHEEL